MYDSFCLNNKLYMISRVSKTQLNKRVSNIDEYALAVEVVFVMVSVVKNIHFPKYGNLWSTLYIVLLTIFLSTHKLLSIKSA